MASSLKDLREFFDSDLRLPINGKEYRIATPNARQGIRLRAFFADPTNGMDDQTELNEMMGLLGAAWQPDVSVVPVIDVRTGVQLKGDDGELLTREIDRGTYRGGLFDEMLDDGITWPEIVHAGRTALLHYGFSPQVGEWNWNHPDGVGDEGDALGNPLPPEPAGANRATRRAAAKKAPKAQPKKAPSGAAGTASTTSGRARTAKTTPAAARTTRQPKSGTATTSK